MKSSFPVLIIDRDKEDTADLAEDLWREACCHLLHACLTGAPSGVIQTMAAAVYEQRKKMMRLRMRCYSSQ